MKKLIILFIGIMLLVSCKNPTSPIDENNIDIEKEENIVHEVPFTTKLAIGGKLENYGSIDLTLVYDNDTITIDSEYFDYFVNFSGKIPNKKIYVLVNEQLYECASSITFAIPKGESLYDYLENQDEGILYEFKLKKGIKITDFTMQSPYEGSYFLSFTLSK